MAEHENENPWGADAEGLMEGGEDGFSDAAVLEQAQVVEPEAQPQERARDEHGRFKAQPEQPEQPPELIGGKFRSQDDLLRAYQELESQRGDMARQMRDLRALEEKISGLQQRFDAPAPPEITQDQIDANPAYATQLAWETGNIQAMNQALAAWVEEDMPTALMWAQNQAVQQEVGKLRQELVGMIQPIQQASQGNSLARAFGSVRARHPDIDQHLDTFKELGDADPALVSLIRSGDERVQERVIENMYWMARGMAADAYHAAVQQAGPAQGQQERAAAHVASARSVPQRTGLSSVPDWKREIQDSILKGDWDDESDVPAFGSR